MAIVSLQPRTNHPNADPPYEVAKSCSRRTCPTCTRTGEPGPAPSSTKHLRSQKRFAVINGNSQNRFHAEDDTKHVPKLVKTNSKPTQVYKIILIDQSKIVLNGFCTCTEKEMVTVLSPSLISYCCLSYRQSVSIVDVCWRVCFYCNYSCTFL